MSRPLLITIAVCIAAVACRAAEAGTTLPQLGPDPLSVGDDALKPFGSDIRSHLSASV
jgi:hypothetical protein